MKWLPSSWRLPQHLRMFRCNSWFGKVKPPRVLSICSERANISVDDEVRWKGARTGGDVALMTEEKKWTTGHLSRRVIHHRNLTQLPLQAFAAWRLRDGGPSRPSPRCTA